MNNLSLGEFINQPINASYKKQFLTMLDTIATEVIENLKSYIPKFTDTNDLVYNLITNSLEALQSYTYAYNIPYLLQIGQYKQSQLITILSTELINKYLPNIVTLQFLPEKLGRLNTSLNNAVSGSTTLDTTGTNTTTNNFFPDFKFNNETISNEMPLQNANGPLTDAGLSTTNNNDFSQDYYENLRYYLETMKDTQFKIDEFIIKLFKPYFQKVGTIDATGVLG